ncbi:hypothetical protein [Mycolicibacterium arseniciresistens]|uniref:Transposase n=1 Tax=Mycolicibacterium arseniciresistens TaxID=3062257 RepID=A0ABT8UC85_9MYCO|nr:hypothetical protein [Mycolicibacterium arseniciresistens]MDO3634465.1 hypothetical protein [Mycolicibacterium arseniciresistens]
MENQSVLLPEGISGDDAKAADFDAVPRVDDEAISGLKFSVALPSDLAVRTLGERWLIRVALERFHEHASCSIADSDGHLEEPSTLRHRYGLHH